MTTELEIVRAAFILTDIWITHKSGIWPIIKDGVEYLHFETFALN